MPKVLIHIIGSLVACSQGTRDDWRDLAGWLASKMTALYGDQVAVKYNDIFDTDCPSLPPDAKLPIVKINEEVVSMGGKISMTVIRKKLESFCLTANQL